MAEEKGEWTTRAEAFMEDYKALVEKHKIDFASYPVFLPKGSGEFAVVVQSTPVDVSKQPTKSPFVAEEK